MRNLKCPQTKEEFVNRILSYDFNGDIRDLGRGAQIERATPQSFFVYFPDIDRRYELTVSIPRSAQPQRPVAKAAANAPEPKASKHKKTLEPA